MSDVFPKPQRGPYILPKVGRKAKSLKVLLLFPLDPLVVKIPRSYANLASFRNRANWFPLVKRNRAQFDIVVVNYIL